MKIEKEFQSFPGNPGTQDTKVSALAAEPLAVIVFLVKWVSPLRGG